VNTAYFLPGTKRESAGLAYPKSNASLANVGGTLRPMTPADFGKFIADETEKWGNVALNADSTAPKHAKVLSKPIHLRKLVSEVQKMLAA
jgi:hypothetical protein